PTKWRAENPARRFLPICRPIKPNQTKSNQIQLSGSPVHMKLPPDVAPCYNPLAMTCYPTVSISIIPQTRSSSARRSIATLNLEIFHFKLAPKVGASHCPWLVETSQTPRRPLLPHDHNHQLSNQRMKKINST